MEKVCVGGGLILLALPAWPLTWGLIEGLTGGGVG